MKHLLKSLPARILVAIAAGIALGLAAPAWLAGAAATFNSLMGQLLRFLIPLIIIGFVAPAIADVGRRAGRLLVATALLAYAATFLAGLMSYGISAATFPMIIDPSLASTAAEAEVRSVRPWFEVDVPGLMGVTTSLALAFLLGLGCAAADAPALRRGLSEFRTIVAMAIDRAVVPLLPPYIMCIFLIMAVEGRVAPVLATFAGIIGVIFAMHILILLVQYAVAGAIAGKNPLRMLRTMLPAYLTALGTQSSAATIPVTLRQTVRMGVSEDVAGFTVPLCATIHMSGSTLKIVACAMALMMMHGQACPPVMFMHFIAMLGITIIAAPGVPGGAIMASLGLLASILDFDADMQAMMIALYIAMDSFGTACNVTGDGAIAAIIDRFFGKRRCDTPKM
ncbi:MAG: dicarboxylate/amino acid:cation symporter [Muribaculaceae bacterium]|nr:dicarboxylate/amino acid:cation symporter [Muribaculaceae bacterium]MDE6485986.1 dicarboxylate/amino acid:cation symporter [Muribaculaceae bacterium]